MPTVCYRSIKLLKPYTICGCGVAIYVLQQIRKYLREVYGKPYLCSSAMNEEITERHLHCAGKVVYATAPQQHYFDCPYQLSSENAQTADDATVRAICDLVQLLI